MTETRHSHPHTSQQVTTADPAADERADRRRDLVPELALACTSLVLFAAAVVVLVRATEYAWGVEAEFVLGPDDDQSLYGLTYLVDAVILAPAVLAHLVAVLVATYRFAAARPGGGAGWVTSWVAYGLGVLSVGAASAMGVMFVLGLEGVPDQLRDRTLSFQVAPVLVAALAAVVPLLLSGRRRGPR